MTYTCDVGYTLEGSSRRQCYSTGRWGGSVPQCSREYLDIQICPSRLKHSKVVNLMITSSCIGMPLLIILPHVCSIRCATFYAHLQKLPSAFNTIIYCALPLSNVHHFLLIKHLSCSIPVVYCGDPGTPTNGRRTLWSTSYNSVVAYTCDVGYELQGSNTRTCQADGQWSGSLPPCSRKFSVHCFYSSSQQSAPKQLMNNCS